jgi:hypothetical protein
VNNWFKICKTNTVNLILTSFSITHVFALIQVNRLSVILKSDLNFSANFSSSACEDSFILTVTISSCFALLLLMFFLKSTKLWSKHIKFTCLNRMYKKSNCQILYMIYLIYNFTSQDNLSNIAKPLRNS